MPSATNEADRLDALRSYNVLDTVAEPVFDSLTELAAKICGTSMAVLTFLDERRQWFKSRIGVDVTETPREIAFCSHTVQQRQFFQIEDAHHDHRFRENPLVCGLPLIRFYAGAPLLTAQGCAVGTLAVMDRVPRKLAPEQKDALLHLAHHAMLQLDVRRSGWELTERYRAVADASPLPIIMLDQERRIALWNRASEHVFGWRAEEVLGKDNPLVPPSERAALSEMLDEVFSGNMNVQQECKRQRRDGTLIDVNVYRSPVRSETGDVVGAIAILQDITAHKKADTELKQSLSLVSATLESTADGILVVDRKGDIVARNKRFAEIWGLSGDVLLQRDSEMLAAALKQLKDPAAFLERVNELYSNPERDSFETLELADGRIIERYSQPQRIGKEIVGRVWSFRDVTQRAALEAHLRQSQKMEAIGALAGGIAHDFNNLLNVILGYNSLLTAELTPDSPLTRHTDKIRHASERAAGLTRQLLAFSRRQVLRPQVVNINELLSNLAQMLPRVVPENIELKLDLSTEQLFVHADPGQLEQVFMNLVLNARDAMPSGGEVRISTSIMKKTPDQQGCVEVLVGDTGVGIDPTVLPRIFEPFFTTKPTGRGTGLGLSTAYGIIRQSGGTMFVNSTAGLGSTFTVRLPQVSAAVATSDIVSQPKLATGNYAHILLVEDNLLLRPLVAHILSQTGHHVTEALSPEHALQTIAQQDIRIDLLLTDVVMPRMSGGELAKRAQELRPTLKVAFMSGYPEAEIEYLHERAALIEKPFTPEELVEHVRLVLGRDPSSTESNAAQ